MLLRHAPRRMLAFGAAIRLVPVFGDPLIADGAHFRGRRSLPTTAEHQRDHPKNASTDEKPGETGHDKGSYGNRDRLPQDFWSVFVNELVSRRASSPQDGQGR
jgi:hypothetical protein